MRGRTCRNCRRGDRQSPVNLGTPASRRGHQLPVARDSARLVFLAYHSRCGSGEHQREIALAVQADECAPRQLNFANRGRLLA